MELKPSERYAFRDRQWDPEHLFPDVMEALAAIYPTYDFVWDRHKERWICVTWLSWPEKTHAEPIFEVEDADGTFMVPNFAFIEYLKITDVEKKAESIEQYLEQSDREYEEFQVSRQAYMDKIGEDCTADWLDYVRRNPSTRSIVAGWRGRHLQGVNAAMKQSLERGE